jgi:hypothetical protein
MMGLRWSPATRAGERLAGAVSVILVAVVMAALGGCGVPVEDAARAQDPLPSPSQVDGQDPQAPSVLPVVIYLASEGQLVPVLRSVESGDQATGILEALVMGPSARESEAGLSSPVAATDALASEAPVLVDDAVTVTLASGFADLPLQRQVLGLGQVVLSLTEGVARVVIFVDASGDRVAVPIADGTIVGRPLQRVDYASLASSAPPLAG